VYFALISAKRDTAAQADADQTGIYKSLDMRNPVINFSDSLFVFYISILLFFEFAILIHFEMLSNLVHVVFCLLTREYVTSN
jgi:hypothetical protein